MSLLSPQLEAFIAVVNYKTVHAAAEALSITQTAATQRIKALETRLKTTLFIRSRRGMEITQEGEALLRYCQAAKALEGEAMAQIQGSAAAMDITMAITGPSSLMRSRVIPQCLNVAKQFSQLLFQFIVDDIEERHLNLKAGRCDLAIIYQEDLAVAMSHKLLKPEQYVLVCSQRWDNRSLTDILSQESIIDYEPQDQVTFNYLKHYDLFKFANHRRHYVNRTEILAMMVADGLGYTCLAKEFAQPYLDNRQLIELNQAKTLDLQPVLAWYERPEPPNYFSAIIEAIV